MKNSLRITFALILLGFVFTWSSCTEENSENKHNTADDSTHFIRLLGKQVDTTYLKILNLDLTLPPKEDKPKWKLPKNGEEYFDEGAELVDSTNGNSGLFLQTSGKVNNRIPGVYVLTYDANDALGKSLASVTRTVYVVENGSHFLNGNYKVECSCSLSTRSKVTTTQSTYTANITTSAMRNNYLELSGINVGPEMRPVYATRINDLLEIDSYFNPVDFHQSSILSGTVHPTENSFTIESQVRTLLPSTTYKCRSIFIKQTN